MHVGVEGIDPPSSFLGGAALPRAEQSGMLFFGEQTGLFFHYTKDSVLKTPTQLVFVAVLLFLSVQHLGSRNSLTVIAALLCVSNMKWRY